VSIFSTVLTALQMHRRAAVERLLSYSRD